MSQNTTSLLPSQTCTGVDLGDKNCHYCEIGEAASIPRSDPRSDPGSYHRDSICESRRY